MDLDFWWLLVIPVVFGLGWMAARFDLKHLLSDAANLPRSYFRGLNFLLNEQPDKAIDAFIEVVKLDPETTELHFALGSLFRRRGETERAIRVHQNLLNRADLPVNERDHALYELGQDFLKAGLLDRAEQTFASIEVGLYHTEAERSLLTIFQTEKDWARSIAIARKLEDAGSPSLRKEISQFHCELAADALQRGERDAAREELASALKTNSGNVRATILLGDVEAAAGNTAGALGFYTRVESQNAVYLPLVAEPIMKAYQAEGRAHEGAARLVDYLDNHPSIDLLDVAYKHVNATEGIEAAHALALRQMKRAPSASATLLLLEGQIATSEAPRRDELELMRNLIRQRTRNLPRFTCQNCGFRARLFYWQCPGCGHWESYAPRRTETLGSSA
ncbi:lipopolysaccharide assembly protein LapB [Robbsia sp. Bb-Pol-6]|uniref:Lipopolysaccharide assembly protein B n=1 Tax=Robbsia betulipollinis TaxID=2981849 RepID=A0ABT3ZQ18_9BURK|nr:lipopolysaccharide assembly protein LapB [Robbsia betulipollinis]MCY0388639.1 lipopolysaccharide assembly protein LapB [Robbsia betulipollinis]